MYKNGHITPIIYLAIIMLVMPVSLSAQKLSREAEKVKFAYDELMKTPLAPVMQIRYLQAFPDNADDFINVFNPHTHDQLQEVAVDYVKRFRELGYDFEDSVLPKSIAIGKQLTTWSPGAVDELQKTIYFVTDKHRQKFLDIVKEMKNEEIQSMARFLYSGKKGENKNYYVLIEIIERAGEKRIAKQFYKVAKEESEKVLEEHE
ncbi:MAG: hypothetical protein KDC11_12710 [Chitinophagaceae bacterium]|nr:hypothetical protein [Chitinophagaceae bacterium]